MCVYGWHILITTLQTRIDVAAIGPLVGHLQFIYHVLTETLRKQRKPKHVWTGLLELSKRKVRIFEVIGMDVFLLPLLQLRSYVQQFRTFIS